MDLFLATDVDQRSTTMCTPVFPHKTSQSKLAWVLAGSVTSTCYACAFLGGRPMHKSIPYMECTSLLLSFLIVLSLSLSQTGFSSPSQFAVTIQKIWDGPAEVAWICLPRCDGLCYHDLGPLQACTLTFKGSARFRGSICWWEGDDEGASHTFTTRSTTWGTNANWRNDQSARQGGPHHETDDSTLQAHCWASPALRRLASSEVGCGNPAHWRVPCLSFVNARSSHVSVCSILSSRMEVKWPLLWWKIVMATTNINRLGLNCVRINLWKFIVSPPLGVQVQWISALGVAHRTWKASNRSRTDKKFLVRKAMYGT